MLLFLISGILLVSYYVVLKLSMKNVAFSIFFLYLGFFNICLGLVFSNLYQSIQNLMYLLTLVFLCTFSIFFIISFVWSKPSLENKYDVIFVFGAGLFGSRISLSLKKRLDKAIEMHRLNPDATIIVSGGQGPDEDLSEALAMKNYLIGNGIEEKLIIEENQSTSTFENLLFSKQIFDFENKKVALISNQFHVFRVYLIAKKLGINGHSVSAPISTIALPVFYLREYFAFFKCLINKEI